METPAISVIIPLYNVEKYVGECLESILAQTFQNFEVIVIDDCSTDKSFEIVRSYEPKFGNRLKLTKTKKNTGGAGLPRNKGMELSRGEYLSFIDPDDTIMPNTFVELYSAAKKFDAEVVHCEKWYQLPDAFYHDSEYRKNLKPSSWPAGEKIFITNPTLLTNDLEKRINDFSKRWLTWSSCLQFVRRDFLIDNEIKFENIYSEDMLFTMFEHCCAKKYLVLPNVFYFYRLRNDSAVNEQLDISKTIHKYATTLKCGIKSIDKFLDKQEFFRSRTKLKYALFNAFFITNLGRLDKVYYKIPAHDLDDLLRKEFDNDEFMAFIFNMMNLYRLRLNQLAAHSQKRIAELENEVDLLKK